MDRWLGSRWTDRVHAHPGAGGRCRAHRSAGPRDRGDPAHRRAHRRSLGPVEPGPGPPLGSFTVVLLAATALLVAPTGEWRFMAAAAAAGLGTDLVVWLAPTRLRGRAAGALSAARSSSARRRSRTQPPGSSGPRRSCSGWGLPPARSDGHSARSRQAGKVRWPSRGDAPVRPGRPHAGRACCSPR